jgi:hypothetical protein
MRLHGGRSVSRTMSLRVGNDASRERAHVAAPVAFARQDITSARSARAVAHPHGAGG